MLAVLLPHSCLGSSHCLHYALEVSFDRSIHD
jgi:hypothetical protein